MTAIPQYAAGIRKNMAAFPAVIIPGKNMKNTIKNMAEPSKKCYWM